MANHYLTVMLIFNSTSEFWRKPMLTYWRKTSWKTTRNWLKCKIEKLTIKGSPSYQDICSVSVKLQRMLQSIPRDPGYNEKKINPFDAT